MRRLSRIVYIGRRYGIVFTVRPLYSVRDRSETLSPRRAHWQDAFRKVFFVRRREKACTCIFLQMPHPHASEKPRTRAATELRSLRPCRMAKSHGEISTSGEYSPPS